MHSHDIPRGFRLYINDAWPESWTGTKMHDTTNGVIYLRTPGAPCVTWAYVQDHTRSKTPVVIIERDGGNFLRHPED